MLSIFSLISFVCLCIHSSPITKGGHESSYISYNIGFSVDAVPPSDSAQKNCFRKGEWMPVSNLFVFLCLPDNAAECCMFTSSYYHTVFGEENMRTLFGVMRQQRTYGPSDMEADFATPTKTFLHVLRLGPCRGETQNDLLVLPDLSRPHWRVDLFRGRSTPTSNVLLRPREMVFHLFLGFVRYLGTGPPSVPIHRDELRSFPFHNICLP
jgi:hypothetical protein